MNLHDSAQSVLIDQQEIAPRFYELLFQKYPQTQQFFAGVDMEHQRMKLIAALITVERHATTGGWVSENYIRRLGTMHVGLGVEPSMFPQFIDVLCVTLAAYHGNDWTAALESEWRRALESAVELMLTQYPDA